MKFCDKLPKLRKENNLSQEQLADRLGVSRQAISKWESGQSHPDMDKMIQMCGILNCTLEDLLDDGTISGSSSSKGSVNNYFQDFLKFITKVYNMFCSMNWKQKVKCLFELAFMMLFILLLGVIIKSIISNSVFSLFLEVPVVGNFLYPILDNILIICLIVIGIIIFLHLFKIRYLDYFVTVEDINACEKTIEEPIEKKDNNKNKNKNSNIILTNNKEKIIIRDPKHSSLSIFNILLKIIILLCKVFAIFILVFVAILFVCGIGLLASLLYHCRYGIIFGYSSFAIFGCILILYSFLELIYNFIVSRKQAFKKIFIISIIGLVLLGGGCGLTVCEYMSFETANEFKDEDYLISYEEVEMYEDTGIDSYNMKYVIDNSISNIKFQIKYLNGGGYYLHQDNHNYFIYDELNGVAAYKIFLKDVKNKKYRNYDRAKFIDVIVICNEENYNKIINNSKTMYDLYN